MAAPQSDGDKQPTPPTHTTVILLLGTMVDTTWRMFVPIIGLLLLGLWADRSWGTAPWLTVTGMILGIALAALLVQRQIKRVTKK